jgi:hypothetical protein
VVEPAGDDRYGRHDHLRHRLPRVGRRSARAGIYSSGSHQPVTASHQDRRSPQQRDFRWAPTL